MNADLLRAGFVRLCALGTEGGPTVAVKDTIDVAGLPTQSGCRAFADAAPAGTHAEVVQAVLDAGCRIVGKTTLHELAFGMTGINDWAGTPPNPHFPDLVPGGSSSGSAAVVAAGLVDFAIGTDTGGSVRMPAAHCGICGLKPTYGRISRQGVQPPVSSLDCVGPMAADMDRLIAAMAAMDPTFEPAPAPTAPIRLGLPTVAADPLIVGAVRQAVSAAGAVPVETALPLMEESFIAGLTIINAENWAAFGQLAGSGLLGADVAARLTKAGDTTADQVTAAEHVRAAFSAKVDAALAGVDALALPTLPGFPMTVTEARDGKIDLRASAMIRPFNLSGHPALALPLAPINGRPVSLQLIGRKGEDAQLCALGREIARAIAA